MFVNEILWCAQVKVSLIRIIVGWRQIHRKPQKLHITAKARSLRKLRSATSPLLERCVQVERAFILYCAGTIKNRLRGCSESFESRGRSFYLVQQHSATLWRPFQPIHNTRYMPLKRAHSAVRCTPLAKRTLLYVKFEKIR